MKYFILYKDKYKIINVYKFSYNSKKLLLTLNFKRKYISDLKLNQKYISFLNLSEILKKAGII